MLTGLQNSKPLMQYYVPDTLVDEDMLENCSGQLYTLLHVSYPVSGLPMRLVHRAAAGACECKTCWSSTSGKVQNA